MRDIKIQLCRQHWQNLSPHIQDRATAKHLIAAVEIAESLLRENNKLEMECREHRLREAPNEDAPLIGKCTNPACGNPWPVALVNLRRAIDSRLFLTGVCPLCGWRIVRMVLVV